MPRKSVKSIRINPNLRCLRIYPVEGTKRAVEDLVTVGFKLTRPQEIGMARVLLAAAQDWEEIDVTGFRRKERSDHTFSITVTSAVEREGR